MFDSTNDRLFGFRKRIVELISPIEFHLRTQQWLERCHDVSKLVVMGNLIYQAKPRSDISDLCRGWKLLNGTKEFLQKLD